SFKGALFVDAGNIWNVLDNEDNPDAQFKGIADLSTISVGSGFGIRYDFGFFVLRLDTGFKTFNPALEEGRRWFKEIKIPKAVFNVGINYPF
ncbi:MAG: BamA/TamA family outer membrane protein, partial [Nonlabens ulvanivorans]